MYQSSLTSSSRGPSFEANSSSSRGQSFDLSNHGNQQATTTSTSSIYSDPFREPSIEYSRSDLSSSSRSNSNSRASSTSTSPPPPQSQPQSNGRNPWSPLTSDNEDSPSSSPPPPPTSQSRPNLPTSPSSDLSRQLDTAFHDDLPPVRERSRTLTKEDLQRVHNNVGATTGGNRTRSGSQATLKGTNVVNSGGESSINNSKKGNSSPSFLQQFRTGSGWFSPLVEPEPELTREERAQREKERIERLKRETETGTNHKGGFSAAGISGSGKRSRPGLMKRLSSGLELSGFGGGGSGGDRR